MINLLIASEDTQRLAQIAQLVADCGNCRITRAAGRPSAIEQRTDGLAAFDVLLLDGSALDTAELAAIERLCRLHPSLTCMLVTPDVSPTILLGAMRAGVRDVLHWPLDPHALGDALQRAAAQATPRDHPDTRIMSFASCKGGAGTSFIAGNIAYEIAQNTGQRTLLVDLNQHFADAAFLVTDATPPSTLPQLCAQVERVDGAFLDASVAHVTDAFHVLAGAGDPVKAAQIHEDALEWVLGVAIPRYDFVIFDLGVSLNPVSMVALDRSESIHFVAQPNMPHVRAARRFQEILLSLGYPADRLKLVVNRHTRSAERARSALEEVLGLQAAVVVPDDASTVTEAIDQGVPVSRLARHCSVARGLQSYVRQLVEGEPKARDSKRTEPFVARLFGRGATPKFKSL